MDSRRKEKVIKEVEALQSQLFAVKELRPFYIQEKLFLHPQYNITLVKNINNELIGFTMWWNFTEFIFLEYIGVQEDRQKEGVGTYMLNKLKTIGKPIILEICKEKEKFKILVQFYFKQGFKINSIQYMPMQLSESLHTSPMALVSYPNKMGKKMYYKFLTEIYKEEYQG